MRLLRTCFLILSASILCFAGLTVVHAASDQGPSFKRSVDLLYWQSVKDSHSTAELQSYLDKFPNGQFAQLAHLRIKELSRPRKMSSLATKTNRNSGVTSIANPLLPSLADLVSHVTPAVVSVDAEIPTTPTHRDLRKAPPGVRKFFKKFGLPKPESTSTPIAQPSTGCGFFISADGYIVTASFVVKEANEITVRLNDGESVPVILIGIDPETHIALLKVKHRRKFSYLKFAHGAPRMGDFILAFGDPFRIGRSVSFGIISDAHPNVGGISPFEELFQFDAPTNHGDAGGPIINLEGQIVGMSDSIYSPSGGSIGVAFAVPAAVVKHVVGELIEHGHVERGWIGVDMVPVDEKIASALHVEPPHGALVANVPDNSPAKAAGIQPGDVITNFDDQEIKSVPALVRTVASAMIGSAADIVIIRKGKEITKRIVVGQRPKKRRNLVGAPEAPKPHLTPRTSLGLDLADLNHKIRNQYKIAKRVNGVVVTKVLPNSAAASRGLVPGMVISQVEGHKVRTPFEVRRFIKKMRMDGMKAVVLLVIKSDGQTFVALPLR